MVAGLSIWAALVPRLSMRAVPELEVADAPHVEETAGDQGLSTVDAAPVEVAGSLATLGQMSKASAASICIRKAISNDWIRASSRAS